jgi:DNA-binding XRE family transcriptional regulator
MTGTDIHLLRREKGVGQRAVADKLGLYKHTLVDIEANRVPLTNDFSLRLVQIIDSLTPTRRGRAVDQAA